MQDIRYMPGVTMVTAADTRFTGPVIKVIGIGQLGDEALAWLHAAGTPELELLSAPGVPPACGPTPTGSCGYAGARRAGAVWEDGTGQALGASSLTDAVRQVEGADLVCILAGPEATGLAGALARAIREREILTLVALAVPAAARAGQRVAAREAAVLAAAADTVFVVPRDRRYRPEELLGFAVRGITDLLTVPGIVCFDLFDVECMTKGRGVGAIGLGWTWGAGRARRAARAALASPLLHGVDLASVRTGIVNITGGWDFHLAEYQAVVQEVHTVLEQEASWVCGCVIDGQLDGGCRVTVLATGVPALPRGRVRHTGGECRGTRRTGGSTVRT